VIRHILQILAFFFPSPVNVWLHRLAGAQIDRHVSIHPAVLILAREVAIGSEARIKFGTMVSVRAFRLGKKSSIGFFTLVKGGADLLIGDACIIGPRSTIDCSRQVVLDYYSGVGPGSYLYTHGSGMPVTEGYRATFAPIHIGKKAWINMRAVIGPGVTVGEGSIVLPGTVLLENVDPKRMVGGNPAKLVNVPVFLMPRKPGFLEDLAGGILEEFRSWSNEYRRTSWTMEGGVLKVDHRFGRLSLSVNGPGDIVLLTKKEARRDGMYFNLADLGTDGARHPVKKDLEAFMRLYHGLIFLEEARGQLLAAPAAERAPDVAPGGTPTGGGDREAFPEAASARSDAGDGAAACSGRPKHSERARFANYLEEDSS
jgi:acetyltransferase-like isoleucine patch superfamily enzyme